MKPTSSLSDLLVDRICDALRIQDDRFVEIESKKRVLPRQVEELEKYLLKKGDYIKSTFFLDQFLDTPRLDLGRLGASLRLRYKKSGTQIYLQYKGPGFKKNGLLYRSEYSSRPLKSMMLEESHHDAIHFKTVPFQTIFSKQVPREMREAMLTHLGASVVKNISVGPILCVYQKEKFKVRMRRAFLEPSLDRIFAFHITPNGMHPLSTFWEYENEVKASSNRLKDKMDHLDDLLEFDQRLCKKFNLRPEPLDKYHRCSSIIKS